VTLERHARRLAKKGRDEKRLDEKKKEGMEFEVFFILYYYKKSKEEGRGDSVATKGT
jgi:hypothetical protein